MNKHYLISWNYTTINSGNPRGSRFYVWFYSSQECMARKTKPLFEHEDENVEFSVNNITTLVSIIVYIIIMN